MTSAHPAHIGTYALPPLKGRAAHIGTYALPEVPVRAAGSGLELVRRKIGRLDASETASVGAWWVRGGVNAGKSCSAWISPGGSSRHLTTVQSFLRFGHLTSVQKPCSAARPEELESPTF